MPVTPTPDWRADGVPATTVVAWVATEDMADGPPDTASAPDSLITTDTLPRLVTLAQTIGPILGTHGWRIT